MEKIQFTMLCALSRENILPKMSFAPIFWRCFTYNCGFSPPLHDTLTQTFLNFKLLSLENVKVWVDGFTSFERNNISADTLLNFNSFPNWHGKLEKKNKFSSNSQLDKTHFPNFNPRKWIFLSTDSSVTITINHITITQSVGNEIDSSLNFNQVFASFWKLFTQHKFGMFSIKIPVTFHQSKINICTEENMPNHLKIILLSKLIHFGIKAKLGCLGIIVTRAHIHGKFNR